MPEILHADFKVKQTCKAGLDFRLADETGMPIRVSEHPLFAVAYGSGQYGG